MSIRPPQPRQNNLMKLLTVTTLYPNAAAPSHGVFVENRLDAWRRAADGAARVIAPVPWFPSTAKVFGAWARHARAPLAERRRDIDIVHPRYFLAPKVGMDAAPAALARVIEREARAIMGQGYDFDLIDGHYLYPDGVAAVTVASALGKPVVLTARGSDVTLLTNYPKQRAMILDAVQRADAVVCVAAALKDGLVALGAPAEKIVVLRNGVDLNIFKPQDRIAIRRRMGLEGPVIASVGHLIDRKGHDLVIEALAEIPEATLLIAGDGPEERRLKALAQKAGAAARVRFLGRVDHEALVEIYNAADALALASTREGWPNVLLEAMACGTPAVATDAGGSAEVLSANAAGRIVRVRTPNAFATALKGVIAESDRAATRVHAEAHSWEETSIGLSALYRSVLGRRCARAAIHCRPLAVAAGERPKLIFTVDTEEEFDWSDFHSTAHRVSRPAHIDRLQSVCESMGVRPLYFITYPLMIDAEVAGYFRRLSEDGRADLGLHLHQWVTPPTGGFAGEYYSWQSNLPPDIHAAKLSTLVAAFESAFGFRPTAHRAGRYGVSPETYYYLAHAGVTHDFSPSASFDFSARGGPDFSALANEPFVAETAAGDIFVTPVCGARALRGGRAFLKNDGPPGFTTRHRAYSRRLTAPFRLSCEQARLSELISLTKSLSEAGTPVLTFSLHSTSMTPGGNPYSPDAAAVNAQLDLIRRYLDFFTNDFQGETVALKRLAALYSPAR